ETTATEQDYSRVSQTGVWLLPSAIAGDIDFGNGTYTPTLVAAATPPRITMTCDNPALLFTPPGCSVPDPVLSPLRWDFGDGARASTPTEGKARASFSSFVRHPYTRPGKYAVSVTITAAGSTDTMTLPITVHPPLQAQIGRDHGRAVAVMRGG